jgi:hypothetical protein
LLRRIPAIHIILRHIGEWWPKKYISCGGEFQLFTNIFLFAENSIFFGSFFSLTLSLSVFARASAAFHDNLSLLEGGKKSFGGKTQVRPVS